MKKKFSRILGVALTIVLLTSLMVASVPTLAAPLALVPEKNPTNQTGYDYTVLTGVNIVDIATSGDTVYVATDNNSYPLLKSIDGGVTWSNLAGSSLYFGGTTVDSIGMASDDADTIAVLTANNKVLYTTTAGATWSDLGAPTTGISNYYDVAVSSGVVRNVALVGDNSSSKPVVNTFMVLMGMPWVQRYGTAAGASGNTTTAMAVEYSPNYDTDKMLLVVTGNTTTEARLEAFWAEANTWNDNITHYIDWGTGIDLSQQGALVTNAIAGGLAAADIALPATYDGTDIGDRLAFVALAGATGGGAYRVLDTRPTRFKTWNSGELGRVGSIAYHESGKVIVGSYDAANVYQVLSPLAPAVAASRPNTYKQPSGSSDTIVRWAGDTAVAGTTGSGTSAFATSPDDGYAFNDISLIDESLTNYSDVAVNADSSKIYLVTNDSANTSVWLKESGVWQRVYNLAGKTAIIVRIAPDDDSVVYLADLASSDVWVSKDSGLGTWKKVSCYKYTGTNYIVDMVVESADVAYLIDGGTVGVSKTDNAGASWGRGKKPIDTVVMNNIALAPNGDVLVGCTKYIAFSLDGGATFDITTVASSGTVYPAADDDYADNGLVYGASSADSMVYRGVLDRNATWRAKSGALVGVPQGIAQVGDVTYVLTDNATASQIYRSLTLETAADATAAEWSYIAPPPTVAANLTVGPQALKTATAGGYGPGTYLYAVATNIFGLMNLADPIATSGPALTAPADGADVAVNAGTGRSYDVTFILDRYNSSS
ncbi:WD40/YVTN/BNR-like repeat-containing protein, partial [Chloroflexota bacterium]